MIRFWAYTLLVALTLQSLYRSILTVDYQLHLPEYLAKCINKEKPQLHCNGQCVLMKKIQEKEKEETKKNMLIYEYSSLYVHKTQPVCTMCPSQEETDQTPHSPYKQDYAYTYHTSIFHPPIA